MSVNVLNRNRAHAIQQLKKGVKNGSSIPSDENLGDVQLLASIANALIYIGDNVKDLNDILRSKKDIDLGDE